MDKPKNGSTITIKLNGEKQTFIEESKEKELETGSDPVSPVITIDSNLSEADGFLEAAAAQESAEESFDWIIPESSDNDIEEYKIVNNQKSSKKGKVKITSISANSLKKKGGAAIKSTIISVVFAILLGTGFGFLMLKLVISGHNNKPATTTVSNVAVQNNTDTNTAKTDNSTTSATVKPINAFVVQGGVFSTKDAAKGTSDLMDAKGIPSEILAMNNKEYLFIGVTDSIETAKQLVSYYNDKGLDNVPYAKSISSKEKTVSDLTDAEKGFLESSLTIYQDLSKMTANALLTKTISSNSIKSSEGLLNKIESKKIKNEKVKNLKSDLTTAVEKVKAYQKSKTTKNLEEAQQKLLNFLTIYYSL